MTRIVGRHLLVAGFLALMIHAAVAMVIAQPESKSGAQGAGVGGVEVSLGPTGGAPGSVAAAASVPMVKSVPPEAAPQPEMPREAEKADVQDAVTPAAQKQAAEIPADVEAKTPVPQEVEAQTPSDAPTLVAGAIPLVDPSPVVTEQALPLEAREPEQVEATEPMPVNAKEPKPIEATESKSVEATEPTVIDAMEPEPPEPEQVEAEPVEPKNVEAESAPPIPTAKPVVPQEQPVEEDVAESETPVETAALSVPSFAGAGGKAGSMDSQDAGSADASTGGGNPGATADYVARLQAWLQRHQEYPRRSKRRREQGTALLFFVMDRHGHVMDAQIRGSSGFKALDKEVLALVHRAEPLPLPPADVGGDRIQVVVPVDFVLR